MPPTDDTRVLKTADWHLRRAIGNALVILNTVRVAMEGKPDDTA